MAEDPQSMDQHDALMEDSCGDTMREEEECKSFESSSLSEVETKTCIQKSGKWNNKGLVI